MADAHLHPTVCRTCVQVCVDHGQGEHIRVLGADTRQRILKARRGKAEREDQRTSCARMSLTRLRVSRSHTATHPSWHPAYTVSSRATSDSTPPWLTAKVCARDGPVGVQCHIWKYEVGVSYAHSGEDTHFDGLVPTPSREPPFVPTLSFALRDVLGRTGEERHAIYIPVVCRVYNVLRGHLKDAWLRKKRGGRAGRSGGR